MTTLRLRRIKNIIERYEEILDKTKDYEKKTMLLNDVAGLERLLDDIEDANKEIHSILARTNTSMDEIEETLIKYILSISLPYERDLLNNIAEAVGPDNPHHQRMKRIIEHMNYILSTYT